MQTGMKPLALILAASVGLAMTVCSSQAQLGKTLAECKENYLKNSWLGGSSQHLYETTYEICEWVASRRQQCL
jgi:hypothetical protein